MLSEGNSKIINVARSLSFSWKLFTCFALFTLFPSGCLKIFFRSDSNVFQKVTDLFLIMLTLIQLKSKTPLIKEPLKT